MRLYVPAAIPDLIDPERRPLRRLASAVTPRLRAALPQEDEEGLELSAFLTAADLSVLAIAQSDAPPRRVVLAVQVSPAPVPDGALPADLAELEDLPSVLGVVDVDWSDVVAVHIDEDTAEVAALVTAAREDADALDVLGDVDLLWFDASELPRLRAELGGA